MAWSIFVPLIFSLILGGVVGFGVVGFDWPTAEDHRACDIAVQTLLTTHDPVELQRVGILVKEMNCDVRRRATPVLVRG